MRPPSPSLILTVLLVAAPACSSAPAAAPSPSVQVSHVAALRGVPDRGMDPSVVAVVAGGSGGCSGTLIAPDVVLTARHCTAVVAQGAGCPSKTPDVVSQRDPATISVWTGADLETAVQVAQGMDVFVPATDVLCGADIALVLLDRTISNLTPAKLQQVGVAKGAHVRTVGYGGAQGDLLLREHVPVASVSGSEMVAAEAPCLGMGGGAAFDETTGHVTGVLARSGPCTGAAAYDVYTRVDVFYSLVAEALASSVDAADKVSETDTHDPTDLGGACFSGADCGAGVCVDAASTQYCSQPCSPSDKCPTDYTCVLTDGVDVCVHS